MTTKRLICSMFSFSENKHSSITLIVFLSVFFFTVAGNVVTAQHFQPVNTGNPYLPMNIIIDSALIDNGLLQANDEIAAFDTNTAGQEICVGQVTILGSFTADTNYTINASADDPNTTEQDGFIAGHNIIFRYWDDSENCEIVLINKTFNAALDNKYQVQGTALVFTNGYSYETWTGAVDTVWSKSGNWNFSQVPDNRFDVLIPFAPNSGNYPSISVTTAKCKNLTIENNAMIKIHGKLTLGSEGIPTNQ